MYPGNNSEIEFIDWSEARPAVARTCAEVTSIIDAIDPDSSFRLAKVRYPFGSLILDYGLLHLPLTSCNTIPVTDTRLPASLRQELDYMPIPLGIITKNKLEIYKELEDRVFSVAFFGNGLELGIWEFLGSTTPYSISAGARSLYMVPRISVVGNHKKLKKEFAITSPPSKQPFNHWHVFKEIANSPNSQDPWECEVLFLTKKWHDKLKENSPQWQPFNNYLTHKGWEHSGFGRKKVIFDIVWQSIAHSLSQKTLKPNPYIIDTLKHLMFIAIGELPGFAPAIDNSAGPIDKIQTAYTDIYGLKEYIPTIMAPSHYVIDSSNPVYYSLQTPTLLESAPKTKNPTSNADDIRELKELIVHLTNEAFDNYLQIENTPIKQIIDKICFTFYHGEMYAYGDEILPTKKMPIEDERFLQSFKKTKSQRFAENGAFVRGCIKVSSRINTEEIG